MTGKVSSRIDVVELDIPAEDDIWAQFRQVERITLELTQSYKYSLGKYSRFFMELENRRFMATLCKQCQTVYAPPRPLCPNCLMVTEWVELAGEGEVKTYSILHFSPGSNEDVRALTTPYILAYVQLDGARYAISASAQSVAGQGAQRYEGSRRLQRKAGASSDSSDVFCSRLS